MVRKLAKGEKLTDIEIMVFLLDHMDRKMENLRDSLSRRIEDTNSELKGDVKLLHQEISSIKSDLINLLKERLGKS